MAGPFAFIILLSMVKDAFEDYLRHEKDKDENDSCVKVWNRQGGFDNKKWSEVQEGDLVHLNQGESVPADILALWSDDSTGQIFVETKSLDGETNLKIINVPAEINAKYDWSMRKMAGFTDVTQLKAQLTTE